jgi:hypothetical protein
MRVSIVINQQLDQVGDEFMNERDFDITFEFYPSRPERVWFDIEELNLHNCSIDRAEFLGLALLFTLKED